MEGNTKLGMRCSALLGFRPVIHWPVQPASLEADGSQAQLLLVPPQCRHRQAPHHPRLLAHQPAPRPDGDDAFVARHDAAPHRRAEVQPACRQCDVAPAQLADGQPEAQRAALNSPLARADLQLDEGRHSQRHHNAAWLHLHRDGDLQPAATGSPRLRHPRVALTPDVQRQPQPGALQGPAPRGLTCGHCDTWRVPCRTMDSAAMYPMIPRRRHERSSPEDASARGGRCVLRAGCRADCRWRVTAGGSSLRRRADVRADDTPHRGRPCEADARRGHSTAGEGGRSIATGL
mmetsp:Transcript_15088/g.37840  ORF Transcript_15088/g.37840 Transcript_15088/m.37840 type:complete len:290 (-) Transcript_15088:44-913(-)